MSVRYPMLGHLRRLQRTIALVALRRCERPTSARGCAGLRRGAARMRRRSWPRSTTRPTSCSTAAPMRSSSGSTTCMDTRWSSTNGPRGARPAGREFPYFQSQAAEHGTEIAFLGRQLERRRGDGGGLPRPSGPFPIRATSIPSSRSRTSLRRTDGVPGDRILRLRRRARPTCRRGALRQRGRARRRHRAVRALAALPRRLRPSAVEADNPKRDAEASIRALAAMLAAAGAARAGGAARRRPRTDGHRLLDRDLRARSTRRRSAGSARRSTTPRTRTPRSRSSASTPRAGSTTRCARWSRTSSPRRCR